MAKASIHLSYLRLRGLIGICGIALPVLGVLITGTVLPSISHYFYSTANVFFIGILTLLGIFLIAYKGFDKGREWVSDNMATTIGGIAILLVVYIPTNYNKADFPDQWLYSQECPTFYCSHSYFLGWINLGLIHFIAAGIFFLAMSWLSIFNFTKGNHPKVNRLYIACGIIMLLLLLTTLLFELFFDQYTGERFVFIMECIMLLFFALSWLVKGKMLRKLV